MFLILELAKGPLIRDEEESNSTENNKLTKNCESGYTHKNRHVIYTLPEPRCR
jgi:hypothetical protein